jgi:hypothetical protein
MVKEGKDQILTLTQPPFPFSFSLYDDTRTLLRYFKTCHFEDFITSKPDSCDNGPSLGLEPKSAGRFCFDGEGHGLDKFDCYYCFWKQTIHIPSSFWISFVKESLEAILTVQIRAVWTGLSVVSPNLKAIPRSSER